MDDRPTQPAGATDVLWFGIAAAVIIPALLLFYTHVYAIHQDLAGSALSARLAEALGASFPRYALYFPPAEQFWFSLAARLADGLDARLDLVVITMTALMVLISSALAYRIRQESVGAGPAFFFLPLAVLIIVPILFKNVFGLREHLVVLGLWPYLVLRASETSDARIGRPLRLLLGVWMGATLLFKYLYAAAILIVELTDAALCRRPSLLFRIENVVAGAIVALYLFTWLVIDPAQRAAIAAVSSAIEANFVPPIIGWFQIGQYVAYATFVALILHSFKAPLRTILMGLAMVASAVFVAWMQGRWYSHHLFPILMAFFAWWWMASPFVTRLGHAAMAIALAVSISSHFKHITLYQQEYQEMDRAMRDAGISLAGKRVGVLNVHPSPYNEYLAAHHGVRWNASVNNSYVAAELKPFDRRENAGKRPPPVRIDDPGRRMLHDAMLRLWEDMPPDVLILDHSTQWPLRYIDIDWTYVFSNDPRFNAILARYRPVMSHDGTRLEFTYYERVGAPRD